MSETVECDTHGSREATFVCKHVIESLGDAIPRGFLWSVDEDGEFQAVCSDCRAMRRDLWEQQADDLCEILCFECYCRAADLNGVSKREFIK